MHLHDYLTAIVFGLVIGIVARIVLPGRQRIGLIFTVLVGMAAALAGTWLANRYHLHSSHFFTVAGHRYDWAVVGVQVGVAVLGVGIIAAVVRAFTTDRDY